MALRDRMPKLWRKTFGFGPAWAAMLWRAMQKSGKGYRYPKMRRGKDDRRADKVQAEKLGIPPCLRRYQSRYA
jgi:hypothetical protein